MGKLSVQVQELRTCASLLVRQAAEVKDVSAAMGTVYGQLDMSWDGSASREYLNRLKSAQQEAEAIAAAIREYRNALNRLADEIEEQDRREEARIRAMMIALAVAPPVGIAMAEYEVGKAITNAVSGNNKTSGGGGGASFGGGSSGQTTNLGATLGALGNNKKK